MALDSRTPGRAANTALWTTQAALAALFLIAGWTKLAMPIAELAAQSNLPGELLRFIGIAELLGAFGLILPGLFRIRRDLTVMAAAGLAMIMTGAVVLTTVQAGVAAAALPLMTAILLAAVLFGRRSWTLSIS